MVLAGNAVVRAGRPRGQVIILFAMFLVVLVGMVGLAVDGGFADIHRRTLQDGADVAAESAVTLLAADLKAPSSPPYTEADICSVFTHVMNSVTAANTSITSSTAVYTDGNGNPLTPTLPVCPGSSSAPPLTGAYQAIGIKASGTDVHPTYFMSVFGINQSSETSTATALVQVITGVNTNGVAPFMAWNEDCSTGSPLVVGSTVTYQANGFASAGACGSSNYSISSSNFKGYFHYTGVSAGLGGNGAVSGGNAFGTDSFSTTMTNAYNSGTPILFPLVNSASGTGSGFTFNVVGFVAMQLTSPPGTLPATGVVVAVVPDSSLYSVCTTGCTYTSPTTVDTLVSLAT